MGRYLLILGVGFLANFIYGQDLVKQASNKIDSVELFFIQQNYKEVKAFGLETVNFLEKNNLDKNPGYLFVLTILIDVYKDNFNIGEELNNKYLNTTKELYSTNVEIYSGALFSLFNFYQRFNVNDKALLYINSAIDTLELYKPQYNSRLLQYKIHRFYLLNSMGYTSETINEITSLLYNTNIEQNSYEYLGLVRLLGMAYASQNDFTKSISYTEEALKLIIPLKNEKFEDYLSIKQDLAQLYLNNFILDKASELVIEIKNEKEKKYGTKNISYVQTILLLSLIYNSAGLYEKSDELQLTAKNIFEEIEYNGYEYYLILTNLISKNSENNPTEAILDYEEIISQYKQINDELKARIYYDIAYCYLKLGNTYQAKLYIQKSIEQLNGLDYIKNELSLWNYYKLYSVLEDDAAEEVLIKGLDFSKNLLLNFIRSSSQNELFNRKEYYYKAFLFEGLNNLANYKVRIFPIVFENYLLYQNLSLRNQTRIRQTILEQGDQKTKELYQSYLNNNNRLIRLETELTENSIAEYKRLSEINENIEKELIKQSAEFADAQKDLQIQWTDLRDKLAPNEAIVDLVSFHLFEDNWTDKIQYAAFIVRKNSEQPEFVSLFEEKELSSLLSLQNHDSIYQSDKLYQLFIKPIENKLSGINTLYYSPSGLAHQIDFSAIALPGDDQILDKYKIHLLSTPAQLRKFKELALHSNSEIILYGDIDYDKEIHQNSDKQLNETELHSLSDLLTRSGIGGWSYLPGTKKEVELIEHSAKEKLIKTKVYKGSEATKESLMTLSGKTEPFVLHLATHGFFFENTVQKLPENFLSTRSFGQMVQVSENPMLRSGLVLSGANKSWHKDTSGKGIVTAAEIANLDLRNCDLVVLSACDTGLGDINGSEGVYGLQRAFKLAGVKNIIMSLWKVPDAQTSEMFELFYQELLNGKSIHQSFVEAQTKMKEKYSPYYWAGFVLLE